VVKTDAAAELVSAVRAVHAGAAISEPINSADCARATPQAAVRAIGLPRHDISLNREREVLKLIGEGRDHQGSRATPRISAKDRAGASREP